LINSALASSSLPMVCVPREMQDARDYVDGGIRTLLPIQSAIQAGADVVYGVVSSLQKVPTQTLVQIQDVLPAVPLLGIALRVGEGILPDEVARRDIMPDTPYPVPTIIFQPSPQVADDVHDSMTLEPGLIRIRMAYGFMRAYDTYWAYKLNLSNYSAYAEANTFEGKTAQIINLRKQAWEREFTANMRSISFSATNFPPQPYTEAVLPNNPANQAAAQSALASVSEIKKEILGAILARQVFYDKLSPLTSGAASMPADFLTWAKTWEQHNWTPTAIFPN
jgi:NTE family protein